MPGGGGHSYIMDSMDVSGTFKPLPFADQNFDQILDPLQKNGGKFSKIYTLKRRKINF